MSGEQEQEQSVEQEPMIDDFFAGHDLVDQESGEVVETATQPNATSAETDTQTQQQQAGQPPVPGTEAEQQAAAQDTTATAGNENAVPDPFAFEVTNEDGTKSFDVLSAMDFLETKGNDAAAGSGLAELPTIADPNAQSAAAPGTDAPAQEMSVDELARANVMSYPNYMKSFMEQYPNATLAEAIGYADRSVNADLTNFSTQNSIKDVESRLRKELMGERDDITKGNELERLKPDSTRNLHEAAKRGGYKDVQHLTSALMNPNYGGKVINHFFAKDSQGKTFANDDERKTAISNWWTRFSADSQNVAILETVTKANIFMANFKEITDSIRQAKVTTDAQNAEGNGMGNTSVQNQTRKDPSSQATDPLSAFFGAGGIPDV